MASKRKIRDSMFINWLDRKQFNKRDRQQSRQIIAKEVGDLVAADVQKIFIDLQSRGGAVGSSLGS